MIGDVNHLLAPRLSLLGPGLRAQYLRGPELVPSRPLRILTFLEEVPSQANFGTLKTTLRRLLLGQSSPSSLPNP